jgi:hypothetical protein
MAKIEKKSIAELVASRTKRPTPEEIDSITHQIHSPAVAAVIPPAPTPVPFVEELNPTLSEVVEEKIIALDDMTQTKRISVNASIPLYIKAKTRATIQGKTLMAYIINLMEKDLKDM